MLPFNRREVLAQALPISVATTLNFFDDPKIPQTDRERVLAAGMTEAEADAWEAAGEAAGKFFDLPELHPMDKHEVASAIHILQNKLLSRPAYRRYIELAKAADTKKPQK